jgi:hypothetical protein
MKPTHEPLPGENTPLNGRRIQVPTDFSKPSECAVKIAGGAENGGGFNCNRNARPWRAGHGLARQPGEKAVRHAPCPVLVARRPEDFSATNSKRDQ